MKENLLIATVPHEIVYFDAFTTNGGSSTHFLIALSIGVLKVILAQEIYFLSICWGCIPAWSCFCKQINTGTFRPCWWKGFTPDGFFNIPVHAGLVLHHTWFNLKAFTRPAVCQRETCLYCTNEYSDFYYLSAQKISQMYTKNRFLLKHATEENKQITGVFQHWEMEVTQKYIYETYSTSSGKA